ncbi:MAG: helix-turn-helix domain-containing protein [Holosporaceae bacterium]|jgi:transcriptional regulator with XRE-family HTH domain|nr:helix-turn-helix domain-containing protein [Holosporaceae bacterium]
MIGYSPKNSKSSYKDLDLYIGNRVKFRRSALGISQDRLGMYLGITFQQIQKYEKGVNRISASTLYNIANALSTDFAYFVRGYQNSSLRENNVPSYEFDNSKKKESMDLLRSYYKITDPVVRKKILSIIKTFATTTSKNAT